MFSSFFTSKDDSIHHPELAFLLILCIGSCACAAEPLAPKEKMVHIHPGMTAEEVRNLLGPPQRIARQILYRRHLELWIYEMPAPLWIEFNFVKGQDSRVINVQSEIFQKP